MTRILVGPALMRAQTALGTDDRVNGIAVPKAIPCVEPTRVRGSRQPCDLQEIPYRNRFSETRAAYILARMRVLDTTVIKTLNTRFRRAIAKYCARKGLSARAFGVGALGDPGFVSSLDAGRSPRLSTVDRALLFMGDAPLRPAFRDEVEAFLTVTGIKRSVLGTRAAGNPSFVAGLRRGISPTLATVDRVRGWMAAHASAAETSEIERRSVRMPVLLSEAAGETASAPFTLDSPPSVDGRMDGRTGGGSDGAMVLNTRKAAERLGLSPRTLARYRMSGTGPAFLRLGKSVRYRPADLDAWAAGRRRRPRSRNTGMHSSAP